MRGRTWTTGEVRQLRALRAKGFSVVEIGSAIGRSRWAVQSYLYYLKRYYGQAPIPKLPAHERRMQGQAS